MNRLLSCEGCPFLRNGGKGIGYHQHCQIAQKGRRANDSCIFLEDGYHLNNRQTAKILSYHNKWRRGSKGKMVSGYLIGYAIDRAIRCLRKEEMR